MNLNRRVHRSFDSFKTLVSSACEHLWPGIGRYDRPIYGRVLKVSQLGGTVSATNKLWSCDIQPLTLDLEVDPTRPKIQDVPVDPVVLNASGIGLFSKPFSGQVVRVAWMGGSRAHPFIQSFTAEGKTVPLADLGDLSGLLYQLIQDLISETGIAVVAGTAGTTTLDTATIAKLTLLLNRIPK